MKQIREAPPYPFSGSLASEISSAARVVEEFSSQLNGFLRLKHSFETAYLREGIDAAQSYLNRIINTYGRSIWAIEAAVMLASHRGGLEAMRHVILRIHSETKNPMVQFFSYWIMRRAEPVISAASYSISLNDTLSALRREKGANSLAIANYIEYRLNFPRLAKIPDLALALWRESQYPLIDYYNAFVRLIQCLVGSEARTEGSQLATLLPRLSSAVHDPRLNLLCAMVDPDSAPLPDETESVLAAIDAYTRGNYSACAKLCENHGGNECAGLALYELHAKCTITGNLEYKNPFEEASPGHELYEKLYSVLNKDEKTPHSIQSLLKVAYTLDNLTIGPQLAAFCAVQLGSDLFLPARTLSVVTGTAISPRLAESLEPKMANRLLARLGTKYPNSVAIRLFDAFLSGGDLSTLGIPDDRFQKYFARRLEQSGEYERAADEYKTLRILAAGRTTYEEDAATGLFRCLLKQGDASSSVQHVVDIYLGRRWLLMSVRLSELLEPLRKDKKRPVKDLDWPLVFHIYFRETRVSTDMYPVFVAYDEFLTSHMLKLPSELGKHRDHFDRRKLISFLRHVCVRDVMDNSPTAFKSASNLDGERIAVCQLLLDLDPDNIQQTEREIVELTTRLVIRRALKDVGERRVHVDVRGIRELLGPELREKFQRYAAHAAIQDERIRRSFAQQGIQVGHSIIVVNLEDEAFRSFKELFNEFKSKFLFSRESGLNFYLSLRIRHGWIGNHLRRTFDLAHLVTTKDKAGTYGRNEFWVEQLKYIENDTAEELDSRLRAFSKGIDETIERVRDKLIQIRGRANDEQGLFDFDYKDAELRKIHVLIQYGRVTDFDVFSEHIFAELWRRTEEQLEGVRRYILGDLKAELIQSLDRLEGMLAGLERVNRGLLPFGAITSCRTDIQRDLQHIAGWFNVAERKDIPDYDASLLVDTGLEIIRKLHPTRAFIPETTVQAGILCRGETFVPFIEVLQILLDNVLTHGGGDSRSVRIDVREEKGWLLLDVRNPLREGLDIEKERRELEARRAAALAQSDAFEHAVAREVGTGFYKIFGILRGLLLRADQFDVYFEIEHDHEFAARLRVLSTGVRP
ncbi:MAG TPA: hypothetical protein VG269_20075 [Tepidisphaeraceae bacterium]|jgi:hypothetical protein|nr:hypothetical protein [Tepidisphaeraceae bacterium]